MSEKRNLSVIALAFVTIAGGIWLDSRTWWWSQAVVNVWAWAALAWVSWRTDGVERRCLLVCVFVAAVGECFLGFVWGLYEYRLGNLPIFIPPGHALVFAAGTRLARFVPAVAPTVVGLALAPFCLVGLLIGFDTQGPFWYLLLLLFLTRRSGRLYTGMFLLALAIESYGTSLGAWRYFSEEHWFGLRTVTSPPLWAGVFYCTLDALVVAIAGFPRTLADLSTAGLTGAGVDVTRPLPSSARIYT